MIRITNSKRAQQIGRRAAALLAFRAAVCLLVVCCLLFNLSPIRAQAVLATSTAVLIGAAAVLILGTMGIVLAPKTEVEFSSVGMDLSNWMYDAAKKPESQITDIQVGIWLEELGNAMDGRPGGPNDPLSPSAWSVFITTQFMLWAKDFLGDRAVGVPALDGYGNSVSYCGKTVFAGEKVYHPRVDSPWWWIPDTDVTFYGYKIKSDHAAPNVCYYAGNVFVSSADFSVTDKNGAKTRATFHTDLGVYYVSYWGGNSYDAGSSKLSQYLTNLSGYRDYTEFDHPNTTTTEVLTWLLGLGPVEEPIDSYMTPEYIEQAIQENISAIEALKQWQAGDPVEVPDIEYGNILTETQTLTESVTQIQTQLAQGNITLQQYLDALTNGQQVIINQTATPNPSPDLGGISTGVGSIVDFITGTTVVESPLTAIRFGDLFDLFPFNIPAGIYETIKFWGTPAAAPVLSFPVPNMEGGKVIVDTYDIRLSDIPGMDRVAAIIRAGELILFAIGLALVTRKVTKW